MWAAIGTNLKMTEGDFGVPVVFSVNGVDFTGSDSIKLTVKDAVNGTEKFNKVITGVSGNTFQMMLSQAESGQLTVGQYVYSLDWYINNVFNCNLVSASSFTVIDKA